MSTQSSKVVANCLLLVHTMYVYAYIVGWIFYVFEPTYLFTSQNTRSTHIPPLHTGT